MNTYGRLFRQPWEGGKDLWLSIHCWLQTWAPAPAPAVKERWKVGREKPQRIIISCVRFNVKREKNIRFRCCHLENKL